MPEIVNNNTLLNYIKDNYSLQDIQEIIALLEEKQTFNFSPLSNGLFSASDVSSAQAYTGYSNVWIRDNIYLAYCHYLIGKTEVAIQNISSLITYFQKFQRRFKNIIEGQVNSDNVMERPHVRFEGNNLTEIDQKWEHAQNDALGYFLWLCCKLIREDLLEVESKTLATIAIFPYYFRAIQYWQDEDSGHWEESRKIEASSIGVALAGLKEMKLLLTENNIINCQYENQLVTVEFLDELINLGTISLNKILPAECIQPKPNYRQYDAALLFLVYPLKVVEETMSERILSNVINNLEGKYGIRRYLGDSFWCRDYKDIPEEIRTTISSEREQWFREHSRELKEGEEAQWCIFDPIISIILGIQFQRTGEERYLRQQIRYLNRSLGQITGQDCDWGEFKCPELYYLQNGQYIANDVIPLLWTQANLRMALKVMEESFKFL